MDWITKDLNRYFISNYQAFLQINQDQDLKACKSLSVLELSHVHEQ